MEENKLARKLSSRHVQMIALGGAIGTGLFWVQEMQFIKPVRFC